MTSEQRPTTGPDDRRQPTDVTTDAGAALDCPPIRSFHHADHPVDELLAAKGTTTVSVCLPARNEATTVGAIVEVLVRDAVEVGLVDELVVIDDHSVDATARRAADAEGSTATARAADRAAWTVRTRSRTSRPTCTTRSRTVTTAGSTSASSTVAWPDWPRRGPARRPRGGRPGAASIEAVLIRTGRGSGRRSRRRAVTRRPCA